MGGADLILGNTQNTAWEEVKDISIALTIGQGWTNLCHKATFPDGSAPG